MTSATSYIDYSNEGLIDISPFGFAPQFNLFPSTVFAQEVLFNSSGAGAWRWSAGAFYRDAKDDWFQAQPSYFNPPIDFTDTSESFAVFGELTRIFLDGKLELTGGLRYFEDEVTQIEESPWDGDLTRPLVRASSTFDNISPRLVLTWHPRDRLTAYTSFSEGFRSGFNQTPNAISLAAAFGAGLPPAHEDKLRNYEMGVKGSLMEGNVSYEAAAYYIDWQDVQQQIDILIPGAGEFSVVGVVNGESASGPGIDFSMSARPVRGLELGVSASWNDLTMDTDVFSGGLLLLKKGDRLRQSTEYTLGASVGYAFPLGAQGLEGRISASATHGSKLFGTRNLSTTGTRQTPFGDALFDSRAGFSLNSPDHWTMELFVDNATNNRGDLTGFSIDEDYYHTRLRPRTIGLQFEYRY